MHCFDHCVDFLDHRQHGAITFDLAGDRGQSASSGGLPQSKPEGAEEELADSMRRWTRHKKRWKAGRRASQRKL